jgi:hypothetical protein
LNSDENSEEDFEDWDSIGLNVSKPPNLLRLYRDFKRHVTPTKVTLDSATQTSTDQERDDLLIARKQLQVQVDEVQQKWDAANRTF